MSVAAVRLPIAPLLAVACATLFAAALWWLAVRPVDIGVDWHGETWASASFAPFRDGQSPLTRVYPTHEQVETDLIRVKNLFRGVRTYTALEGMGEIPELAAKHGLKLTHSAWLGRDAAINAAEVKALIDAANRYPQAVERVIVGNEVLLRRDLTVEQVIAELDRVRAAIKQPVSYADVWAYWLKNPQLAEHVDFITIHILPYWEDEPAAVADMEARFVEVIDKVRAAFPGKPILVGEAGWPTEGRARGPAIADQPHAAEFLRRLPQIAAQHGFDYNVVEAYDQSWKAQLEGTVGARWGLYDLDRHLKFGPAGPVEPLPDGWLRAAASAVPGLLLALWLVRTGAGFGRSLLLALLAQALAAGAIDTIWHALRLSIAPTALTWTLKKLLFMTADAGLLPKPMITTLYEGIADSSYGLANVWAWLRIAAAVTGLGVLAALLRARLTGQPAPRLARVARSGYLLYVAGALLISAMLALNGRYLDIPTFEFWLPALLLPTLWLAGRFGAQPAGFALATLTVPGRRPARRLGLWLLLAALAVMLGEGFAIVGEDFTAMHPTWAERLPLILQACISNREILAFMLMLGWLALPLLAESRRPNP